jgi:hypothetical protein
LLGEIFGLNRDGLSLPYKVKGHYLAKSYFTKEAIPKEGWKFSECNNEELRDVFVFLTPLVNPMKQARITGKFAITVSCLYFGKPVSWAQVLAEVLAQQVKLMGPKNLKVCLEGYLAPIYSAKNCLTRKEVQNYRYTIQGGDPKAKAAKEEEEESATETESDQEMDPESTPETSGEEKEADASVGDQAREEPTGCPPPEKPEVESQTGSEGKGQEVEQSQSPAHSDPGEMAGGQEAQGESTPDPNLSLDAGWQTLQAQQQMLINQAPEMTQHSEPASSLTWPLYFSRS